MIPFVQGLVDAVARVGSPLLQLLVAALAFAESAVFLDLVVPGEVGMVLAGAATAGRPGLDVWTMILAGTVGAVLGDSVGYLVGRRWGWSVLHRWRWTRRLLAPRAERARRYFERHGGMAVAGRWVGALRAVVAVVAGTSRMPYLRFLAWNVLGSLTWVTTVVLAGNLVGRQVSGAVDRAGTLLSVVVVGGLALWWGRRRWRGRRARAQAGAEAEVGNGTVGAGTEGEV